MTTEDLAFMLESMGCATGINIPALLQVRALMERSLQGQALHGVLWRAGLPKTFPSACG